MSTKKTRPRFIRTGLVLAPIILASGSADAAPVPPPLCQAGPQTTGTCTVPPGVTAVRFIVIGGGGGGGAEGDGQASGGGGGGACSGEFPVTAGNTLKLTVGKGGIAGTSFPGTGGTGGASILEYSPDLLVTGQGGVGGKRTNPGGAGGICDLGGFTEGTGYAGGAGASYGSDAGGGGGGGGVSGPGGDGSVPAGGAGSFPGGDGGDGGDGANSPPGVSGGNGLTWGGGGGGGKFNVGGSGAAGYVALELVTISPGGSHNWEILLHPRGH